MAHAPSHSPTPRRLGLHVGLPKTGTSALQRWFSGNPAILGAAGVVYPDGKHRSGDKHQFLVNDLRAGRHDRLRELFESTNAESILLSSEGLTNQFYAFSKESLRRFRDCTKAFQVEVLLVTRRAEAWLDSYHKQCVVNPRNGSSDLYGWALTRTEIEAHPRVRQLLDVPRLSADLLTAFGAVHIQHLRYEDDWFAGVLDWLCLDRTGCPPLPRVNETIPGWAIEVLRRLNASGTPEPRRDWWKGRLSSFLGSNNLELRVVPSPSAEGLGRAGLQADLRCIEECLPDLGQSPERRLAEDFLASASRDLAARG